MKVLRNLEVPTGNILVVEGSQGKLELLSLGDYGAAVNLNQNMPVADGTPLMPLSEKWVVTISTQYGCSMGCTFCDVPKVGIGRNATRDDLTNQVLTALELHPEVTRTKRLNIHFARMGEPTWNPNVLDCARTIRKAISPHIGRSLVHPVISTMMPRYNEDLGWFLAEWMDIKNHSYKGDAGLQISVNSTSDDEREKMFSGNAMTIQGVSRMVDNLDPPRGRKITLNFAVAEYEIDAAKLRDLFDPSKVVCKLTPMHKTAVAVANGIKTGGDYTTPHPYMHHADALRSVGFDVLTFIASRDEDEGRITCGNAILSGTVPHKYNEL